MLIKQALHLFKSQIKASGHPYENKLILIVKFILICILVVYVMCIICTTLAKSSCVTMSISHD